MTDITHADILDALREAMRPTEVNTEGAWTFAQLQDLVGGSERPLRQALQHLAEQGKLEVVRVPFTRVDGTPNSRPAYRIKI